MTCGHLSTVYYTAIHFLNLRLHVSTHYKTSKVTTTYVSITRIEADMVGSQSQSTHNRSLRQCCRVYISLLIFIKLENISIGYRYLGRIVISLINIQLEMLMLKFIQEMMGVILICVGNAFIAKNQSSKCRYHALNVVLPKSSSC